MNEEQIRNLVRVIIAQELSKFISSDKFVFEKNLQIFDGRNFQFGLTNGTIFGTSTQQKFGFHNSTPTVQRQGAAQAAVVGTADGTYSGNEQNLINDLVTLANELRAAIVEKGLIKGAA